MARTERGTRRRTRRLAIAGAVLLVAGTLAAHDTWLMPVSGFTVPVGTRAALELTSAGRFPTAETAIRAERVERAESWLGGESAPLAVEAPGARALRLRTAPLARPGIATLIVSLAPRTLTLTRAQVAHYFDEIGAEPAVREAYARGDGSWTETYVKHAKAYVRVGDAGADSSWRDAIGQRLELVPRRDPTRLRAGTTLEMQLLRCMTPSAGQSVSWVRAGAARARMARTDAEGVVRIPLDRPGRWLVRATSLRPREATMSVGGCTLPTDPSAPDAAWRSDFATLVLDVR